MRLSHNFVILHFYEQYFQKVFLTYPPLPDLPNPGPLIPRPPFPIYNANVFEAKEIFLFLHYV
jgi:hypothetical protein